MPLAVNEQSAEVEALAKQWAVLEALNGGTPAMREGAAAYLPKWPNEEAGSYSARLSTATLFPAYARTVGVMSGKPFSKALTLSDDTPTSIKAWAEDIDQQGVNLHTFASEMFAESFYGLAGVLVEYPDTRPRDADGKVITTPGKVRTKAEVERSGVRPYFVRVMHGQILGWRTAVVGGRTKITQLRILQSRDEADGPYGVKTIPQVRVLFPGGWEVHEQVPGKAEWAEVDSGTTTLKDIPFVPFYGARKGFMEGRPPLLDLAYLNVKHWQSQSDQDTILHVARVPILSVKGVQSEFQLSVGASCAVNLGDNPAAELKWVEHTGAAIEAGGKSLADLQDQMIQTGAELLVKKPGDRSATEAANDAEGNKSDLQRLAEGFEDSLDQALQYMAEFASLPSGGNVSLFKDYGASNLSDASAQLIHALQQGGLISKATAINELKRRGELSMEVDADDEAEMVGAEPPPPPLALDHAPEDE